MRLTVHQSEQCSNEYLGINKSKNHSTYEHLPQRIELIQCSMQANNKYPGPPNLLRGIVITVILTIVAIVSITWLIINSQVEQLVTNRTSEYAHSIARIAADSSSEALLADDVLQLNLLVENVARDPYIRQATIYSEDGTVVSQFPTEAPTLSKPQVMLNTQQQVAGEIEAKSAQTEQSKLIKPTRSEQFIQRQKNIPFVEPIVYQDITAGWFKIEIDSYLLGQKFRDAYFEIQVFSAAIAVALFLLLLVVLYRLEESIKRVVSSCHHLLIQNKIKPSANKKEWIKSIAELSEQHPQQLKEHTILPANQIQWQRHSKISKALVCVFEFEINHRENVAMAESLSLAELHLNKAVQAYGVQSQGDLLTGCTVPFDLSHVDETNSTQQIASAVSLIALVKSLMTPFDQQIQLKACLTYAPILLLEDDHELISGVAILDGYSEVIKKSLQNIEFGETVSLYLKDSQLSPLINIHPLQVTETQSGALPESYLLGELNPELLQSINRKRQYISGQH